jgi:High potential iron-sulfur protein
MTQISHPRRVFLMSVAATGGALVTGSLQAQARVDEADDNAIALGYRHDTTQVDAAKFPAHKADQKCNNCQFWQGSATDAWGGCAMFGRKQVAAAGWCLAYKRVG